MRILLTILFFGLISGCAIDIATAQEYRATDVLPKEVRGGFMRTSGEEFDIATGKREGIAISPKLGMNTDIDRNKVPEDVTDEGGTYGGFPTDKIEKLECFSSSNQDTGTLTVGGILESPTSEEHTSASIVLQGKTPVETPSVVYRAHTMRYDSGDSMKFNVGKLTCRHAQTESNVYLTIAAGRSQSNYMVYTCPYKSTCWIKTIQGSLRQGNAAHVNGAIWFRSYGGSPRYRRPFTIGNNAPYIPPLYGAIRLSGQSDVKATIITTNKDNVEATFGMEIIKVKD